MRHTSRLLAALLLSACVLALPACDSDDGGDEPAGITGEWGGFIKYAFGISGNHSSFEMELLEREDGQVEGDGQLSVSTLSGDKQSTANFTVEGTVEGSEVSLELVSEKDTARYEGTYYEEDEMVGTFTRETGESSNHVSFFRR